MRTPVQTAACAGLIGTLLVGCATFGGANAPNPAGQAELVGGGVRVVAGLLTGSEIVEGRRQALVDGGIGALAPPAASAYQSRQEAELRKRMADTCVDVVRQGDRITLSMPAYVTFVAESAELAPDVQPVLDAIADTLGEYRQTLVEVAGHTDAVADGQYNQLLSERRAAAVADYLQAHGVVPERILIVGAGASHPIADNQTEAGRAENRRVEITIVPVTS